VSTRNAVVVLCAAATLAGCDDFGDLPVAPEDSPLDVGYTSRIQPIFDERCVLCHTAGSGSGDLDLSSREGLLAGGSSGAAVSPGDPAGSLLVQRLRAEDPAARMPLVGTLPEEQVELIETWIEEGALDN